MKLFRNINAFLREVALPNEEPVEILAERFGETITPNMRALRLSMTVADYLLSMGVPVSEVVSTALDITNRYCERKVAVDISSTVLFFSQDRGNDREPLTLIRTSPLRAVNSSTIQQLQEMTSAIEAGRLPLDNAEHQLQQLLDHPKEQPKWLLNVGGGAISAGVGALLSGSLLIIAITFVIGTFITLLVSWLDKRRTPPFFVQVIAAAITTLIAAAIIRLGNNGIEQFQSLNPNLIVIGGIVLLVSGLAIVGAVEDAIDEYYVTANARILRVIMMTAGIVAGIVVGLYLAKKLGVPMNINTNTGLDSPVIWQYVGAIMIAGGYALTVHARLKGFILSGIIGLTSWAVYLAASRSFTSVVASFVAAAVVGAAATLLSRWLRTPSSIMITAGIVPLVPGLSLFNGLMLVIVGTSINSAQVDPGNIILLNALLVALAIAAGATLGNLVTRPVRRTLVRAQNALPSRKLRS